MWSLTGIPVNVYPALYPFKPVFRCAQARHFWVFCWVLIALILDNGKGTLKSDDGDGRDPHGLTCDPDVGSQDTGSDAPCLRYEYSGTTGFCRRTSVSRSSPSTSAVI